MLNPAGGVTNWEYQSFSFVATAASEVLEFVADAVITPPATGAVEPPRWIWQANHASDPRTGHLGADHRRSRTAVCRSQIAPPVCFGGI